MQLTQISKVYLDLVNHINIILIIYIITSFSRSFTNLDTLQF